MKSTVAILGASGFIGRSIVERFANENVKILAGDVRAATFGRFEVESVDLTRDGSLSDWLASRNVDSIIYLASEIPSTFNNVDISLFDNNLKMHRNLLNYWVRNDCHLVYASTCAVYGSSGSLPWREENAPAPENYYSISKLVGEWLFQAPNREGRGLTILRINAPFGVGGRKTVVNIFLESALSGRPITLLGTGQREQDFLYVSDIAEAFWLACSTGAEGTFNIASGNTVTMKQLAEKVILATDSVSPIEYSGAPDPNEKTKVQIDITKAKKHLAFKPAHTLDSGLKECVRLYEGKRR